MTFKSALHGRSAFRSLVLGCLVLASCLQQAYCCMCFSEPLCKGLRSGDRETTVFIGTAVDLYPGSRGIDESLRPSRDRAALAQAKARLLRRWGGVLSSNEVLGIQRTHSIDQLFVGVPDIGLYSRRVRFNVAEWLAGGKGGSFELFTDATSCGYQFELGKVYLVVVFRNVKTGRWETGACSRTAPIGSKLAQEDLKALRASRDGHPLPPRVYGQMFDWRERQPDSDYSLGAPNVLLRLVGESFSRETRSDTQGWFAFDDLPPAKYRLELLEPAAQGQPAVADLALRRCFEASGFIERAGAASIYEIQGDSALTEPPPNIIELEELDLAFPPAVPWQIPPVPLPSFPPPEKRSSDRYPPATPSFPIKNN